MALEIERKFRVLLDRWQRPDGGEKVCQGYIAAEGAQIRVRLTPSSGYLTIKSREVGLVRSEFEYAIPVADAEALLHKFARRPFIEKIRYRIQFRGHVWEVDEFAGEHAGLVLAEVELPSVDTDVELPDWVGEEVTGDVRFSNEHLAGEAAARSKG